MKLEDFKPGVYRHYKKDDLYEADHLMRDANDGARIGVHYIGLELDGAKEGPRHLVRTWEDWNARVHEDGTTCQNYNEETCLDKKGKVKRRFRYLGPVYKRSMIKT